MRGQNWIFTAKIQKSPQRLRFARSIRHHFVRNAGQLRDLGRNRFFRITEGVEFLLDFSVANPYCSDLRNALCCRTEPRCFQVKNDILAFERNIGCIGNDRDHIVDKISFRTVNNLDVAALFPDISRGAHGIRKSLRHSVVGYRNRGMPPFVSALHDFFGRGKRIVGRHVGVQMQLHALLRRVVDHFQLLHTVNVAQLNGIILVIGIKCVLTVDKQSIACGKLLKRP